MSSIFCQKLSFSIFLPNKKELDYIQPFHIIA